MTSSIRAPGGHKTKPARSGKGAAQRGADFSFETGQIASGFRIVAGVDEAGRGPLAGPVVAAAVVLDPDHIPQGLADSKTLSARRREALFDRIVHSSRAVGIGMAPAWEIDAINIRQATFAAMRRAVSALAWPPDYVLIDGRDVPPGLPCPAQAIVKGDARALSIAAASIVAKVVRDRAMTRLSHSYPHYGFEQHAGYPTAAHRQALAQFGPCPFHRMSFAPLKAAQ
jgi:ribonuclease HII